jgi:hypothetical protein
VGQSVDTRWARKKLDRARAHLQDLERSCADWVYPVEFPIRLVVRDGGSRIEGVLDLKEQPPLDDWALLVGDCVHNIRTALDVFVWTNSTALPASQRRNAAYPILDLLDADDDDEDVPHQLEQQDARTQNWVRRKVAGLPEPLQSRVIGSIRWAQGVDDDGEYWHRSLPLIRELDDIDKHRLALELETSHAMSRWSVTARDEAGRLVEVDLAWLHSGEDASMNSGALVVAATPETPVAQVSASDAFELRVRVLDHSLQIRDSLAGFIQDVEGSLNAFERPNALTYDWSRSPAINRGDQVGQHAVVAGYRGTVDPPRAMRQMRTLPIRDVSAGACRASSGGLSAPRLGVSILQRR